jgi:hypothetical protein
VVRAMRFVKATVGLEEAKTRWGRRWGRSKSTASGKLTGAGMLLEEVGARVVDTGPESLRAALAALSALHRAGFCHGSARIDNLLACGGEGGGAYRYKWCDLQRARGTDAELNYLASVGFFGSGYFWKPHCLLWDIESLLNSFGIDWDVFYSEEEQGRLAMDYVFSDFSADRLLERVLDRHKIR